MNRDFEEEFYCFNKMTIFELLCNQQTKQNISTKIKDKKKIPTLHVTLSF